MGTFHFCSYCNQTHSPTNANLQFQVQQLIPNLFQSSIMCAGYEIGGYGSCRGDSGGPISRFVTEDGFDNRRYVQVGIVQGGFGRCGDPNKPGIYVRLEDIFIFNFITRHTRGLTSRPRPSLTTTTTPRSTTTQSSQGDSNRQISEAEFVFTVASNGQTDIVLLALEQGVDFNIQNENGFTPLHAAAQYGILETVKLLVEKGGLKVDAVNHKGTTPMLTAADSGQADIVEYLISKGANVNHVTDGGTTALYLAAFEQHPDVIEVLVDNGANVGVGLTRIDLPPLHIAAQEGPLQSVRILVSKGFANVNQKDKNGRTALHSAADANQVPIISFLISNGANVNAQDNIGRTPLWTAASNGHDIMVRRLISSGASVDLGNGGNFTPLHVASFNGHLSTVRILVEEGRANIFLKTVTDATAFSLADDNGQSLVANYLRSRGAS